MRTHWRRHAVVAVIAVVGIAVGLFLVRYETPKERFVERAGRICEESKRELLVASRAQLGSPSPNREQQATVFLTNVAVPKLRDRMEALRRLDVPDGDDQKLRSLFADYEAVIDDIAADPGAFARPGIDDPFARIDRRLDEYGLAACGTAAPR